MCYHPPITDRSVINMSRFPLALLFSGLILGGCGTKGALSMPPGPAPDPLLGKAPARQEAGAHHVNTDTSSPTR
jgi:predicted small lipoprotein YifL